MGVLRAADVTDDPAADLSGELPRRVADQLLGGATPGRRRLGDRPMFEPDSFGVARPGEAPRPGESARLLSGRGRVSMEGPLQTVDAKFPVLEDTAAGLEAGLDVGGGIVANEGTEVEPLALL